MEKMMMRLLQWQQSKVKRERRGRDGKLETMVQKKVRGLYKRGAEREVFR